MTGEEKAIPEILPGTIIQEDSLLPGYRGCRFQRVVFLGERASLSGGIRRFLWYDRIHAKAMYRMALRIFGGHEIPNLFHFEVL